MTKPTRRELVAGATGIGVTAIAGCLDDLGTDDTSDDESESGGTESPALPVDIPTVDGPGSEAGTVTVPESEGVLLVNFTRMHCPTSEGLLSTIDDARERLIAESDGEEAESDEDSDAESEGADGNESTDENGDEDEGENETEGEDDDGDTDGDEADGDDTGDTDDGTEGETGELEYDVGRDETLTVLSVISGVSGASPSDEELGEWWDEHDGNWSIGVDEDGDLHEFYDVRSSPTTIAIDSDGEEHWRDEGGTASGSFVSGTRDALAAEGATESDAADE